MLGQWNKNPKFRVRAQFGTFRDYFDAVSQELQNTNQEYGKHARFAATWSFVGVHLCFFFTSA